MECLEFHLDAIPLAIPDECNVNDINHSVVDAAHVPLQSIILSLSKCDWILIPSKISRLAFSVANWKRMANRSIESAVSASRYVTVAFSFLVK